MCKGGLLSLTQYPPCAGRGVPSSMDWSGSLVAYNEVDPQGAGYCQKSIDRSILSFEFVFVPSFKTVILEFVPIISSTHTCKLT